MFDYEDIGVICGRNVAPVLLPNTAENRNNLLFRSNILFKSPPRLDKEKFEHIHEIPEVRRNFDFLLHFGYKMSHEGLFRFLIDDYEKGNITWEYLSDALTLLGQDFEWENLTDNKEVKAWLSEDAEKIGFKSSYMPNQTLSKKEEAFVERVIKETNVHIMWYQIINTEREFICHGYIPHSHLSLRFETAAQSIRELLCKYTLYIHAVNNPYLLEISQRTNLTCPLRDLALTIKKVNPEVAKEYIMNNIIDSFDTQGGKNETK